MNWKRTIAIAAVVLGILGVVGIGVGRLFLDYWDRFEPITADPGAEFVHMIETQGFTPETTNALHNFQLPTGIAYVYVSVTTGDRRIIAANQPELEGESTNALNLSLVGKRLQGEEALVTAPDGREYWVGSARTQPILPYRVGGPAFLAGLVAIALAWVALAVWIYLDARSQGSSAAPGWGLLGLLAAPLALAVWIISHRVQTPADEPLAPAPICPGCGADTPRDAAFCVRCGHGLRPACPDCHRPVATDWSYCGTCGTSLAE